MSATAVLQRELQYRLSGNDLRWKIPTPDEVRKVDAKAFRSFWEPLLASGPVEVLLFGDFETEMAVDALRNTVGALKPRSAASISQKASQVIFPAGNAKPLRFTHKGPKDQLAAVIGWPTGAGLAQISEARQLEVLAALFRDRLFEKFRSEQAASYSPDMMANWPDEFRSGGFLMAFSQVKPEDAESFLRFSREIATDLAANAVSKDELQRAVEPAKQAIERTSSGNVFWMNQMEGASFSPERYKALSHYYSDYAGVTAEQLQALAKRYFRPEKAWTLLVEPENK